VYFTIDTKLFKLFKRLDNLRFNIIYSLTLFIKVDILIYSTFINNNKYINYIYINLIKKAILIYLLLLYNNLL